LSLKAWLQNWYSSICLHTWSMIAWVSGLAVEATKGLSNKIEVVAMKATRKTGESEVFIIGIWEFVFKA